MAGEAAWLVLSTVLLLAAAMSSSGGWRAIWLVTAVVNAVVVGLRLRSIARREGPGGARAQS